MLEYMDLVGKKVKVVKSMNVTGLGELDSDLVGLTLNVTDYNEHGILADYKGEEVLLVRGEYRVLQGYYGEVKPVSELVVTAEDLLEDAQKDINSYAQTLLALGLNAPHVEIELVSYVRKAIKQWKEDNQ